MPVHLDMSTAKYRPSVSGLCTTIDAAAAVILSANGRQQGFQLELRF